MAPRSRGWVLDPPRLSVLLVAGVLALLLPWAHAFSPFCMSRSRRASPLSITDETASSPMPLMRLSYSMAPAGDVDMREDSKDFIPPQSAELERRVRQAVEKNTYSIWEQLQGYARSDMLLVPQMPAELEGIAETLLESTRRSRKARITILRALVRSYNARRKEGPATGSRTSSLGTVSQYMQKITSVAAILAESEVDYRVVVAALLAESPLSLTVVEKEFGKSTASIIKGFQRMLEIENVLEIRGLLKDYPKRLQGDEGNNVRNLLLSVAEDWRSVALRVAWTRIDMEGPFGNDSEKTNRMHACLHVYASLAEKAGMSVFKHEIENRAFEMLFPEEHRRITDELAQREERDLGVLRQAQKEVKEALMQDEIFMSNCERFDLSARKKSPYSIFKKTEQRRLAGQPSGIDDLQDIVALRIVCTPVCSPGATPEEVAQRGEELCRYVLSVVHRLRPHYADRVKDYIKSPKENGYQSLHSTLVMRLGGVNAPFEVQMRTHQMHRVAEFGLASHAVYKGDTGLNKVLKANLSGNKCVPMEVNGPTDWLAWLHKTLVSSSVIVFGPDGRLINLSRGTTLSDVVKTYGTLHKRVMKDVRINGKRAFLGRTLNTGDVISF